MDRKDWRIWSLKVSGKAVPGLFIMAESEFVQFEYVDVAGGRAVKASVVLQRLS